MIDLNQSDMKKIAWNIWMNCLCPNYLECLYWNLECSKVRTETKCRKKELFQNLIGIDFTAQKAFFNFSFTFRLCYLSKTILHFFSRRISFPFGCNQTKHIDAFFFVFCLQFPSIFDSEMMSKTMNRKLKWFPMIIIKMVYNVW